MKQIFGFSLIRGVKTRAIQQVRRGRRSHTKCDWIPFFSFHFLFESLSPFFVQLPITFTNKPTTYKTLSAVQISQDGNSGEGREEGGRSRGSKDASGGAAFDGSTSLAEQTTSQSTEIGDWGVGICGSSELLHLVH